MTSLLKGTSAKMQFRISGVGRTGTLCEALQVTLKDEILILLIDILCPAIPCAKKSALSLSGLSDTESITYGKAIVQKA